MSDATDTAVHPASPLTTDAGRQAVQAAEVLRCRAACDGLTGREREVLVLLGNGLTYVEMSQQLGITLETVKTYCKDMRRKLDVQRAVEAVVIATKAGLL